jgi:hypothetical protein
MAEILTAEDVVRRIAAECAYVDERGAVGIRLEPAAAIVRQYGEQFPTAAGARAAASVGENPSPALIDQWSLGLLLHLTFATRKPLTGLAEAKPSKVLTFAHCHKQTPYERR